MPRVLVRPRALADLAEIWAYIADDSVEQADVFADVIDGKFGLLARQPKIGRVRTELFKDLPNTPIRPPPGN